MKNNKISVIINTLNEEKNIKDCLLSVAWADEIILVDMYSDDNTVGIAQQFQNVKVFYHEKLGYADPARAFALQMASNDWVVMLDADERINLATSKKILAMVSDDAYDVIYLRRDNYFVGRLIEHNQANDEYLPRLFKKDYMQYVAQVHNFEQIKPQARIFYLKDDRQISIVHFAYSSVEALLNKVNRYSTIEAENMLDGNKSPLKFWKLVCRYPYRIIKDICINRNYKPLRVQFYMTTVNFFYELTSYIKLCYIKQYGNKNYAEAVEKLYKEINDKIITEYEKDNLS